MTTRMTKLETDRDLQELEKLVTEVDATGDGEKADRILEMINEIARGEHEEAEA